MEKISYRALGSICLLWLLVGVPNPPAQASQIETLGTKKMRVAVRTIGHRFLNLIGDSKSRVLPVSQESNTYRLGFAEAITFDPDDLICVTEEVFDEAGWKLEYLVEVVQHSNGAVAHSFASGEVADFVFLPCQGRDLPADQYEFVFHFYNLPAHQQAVSGGTGTSSPRSNLLRGFFLLAVLGGIFWISRKRAKSEQPAPVKPGIRLGTSHFDPGKMLLQIAGKEVELSPTESQLLSVLHQSRNQTLKRGDILHQVWGDEGDYVGRTLDVFISKLRKKLEPDPGLKIINVRGVGYRLVTQQANEL